MALDLKTFAASLRVTDGAWGTQLQNRGLGAGASPELWNVENPSAVQDVAESYVHAGSDVILTNTFGANRLVLSSHGLGNRAAELSEAGAAISRRAAGDDAKVFASIGPTGKIVMMGDVAGEEISAAFAEQAAAVARGGADAIVLETFNELAELTLAIEAVRGACDLPVVASMTFASGPQGPRTMMGDSPGDLAAAAAIEAADAIGANCGAGPENYVALAALLAGATDLPVWIKPNAGLPRVVEGRTVFPMGPEQFAAFTGPLAEAGASFIGGCCGTTPEHLRAVRAAVDAR